MFEGSLPSIYWSPCICFIRIQSVRTQTHMWWHWHTYRTLHYVVCIVGSDIKLYFQHRKRCQTISDRKRWLQLLLLTTPNEDISYMIQSVRRVVDVALYIIAITIPIWQCCESPLFTSSKMGVTVWQWALIAMRPYYGSCGLEEDAERGPTSWYYYNIAIEMSSRRIVISIIFSLSLWCVDHH